MARPRKGTRGITIDGHALRWRLNPPIGNTDCPLCDSWHIVVQTERGRVIAEWSAELDGDGRPVPVTPATIAEALRGGLGDRDLDERPAPHRHDRLPHRPRR